jgi:hypothetical protein
VKPGDKNRSKLTCAYDISVRVRQSDVQPREKFKQKKKMMLLL